MSETNFKVTKSEIAFSGRVFDIQVDEIVYDSGNPGYRETVLHSGGAVVVPVKDDGKIVMINQYRYPLKKYVTELPAGKLFTGEDPLSCAVRELEEETGYKTEKVVKLGAICTTPGFCSEILHIYIAQKLVPGDHNREEGEYGMQMHEYTFKQIEDMISAGEIYDGKTLSGLMMAKIYLERHSG